MANGDLERASETELAVARDLLFLQRESSTSEAARVDHLAVPRPTYR